MKKRDDQLLKERAIAHLRITPGLSFHRLAVKLALTLTRGYEGKLVIQQSHRELFRRWVQEGAMVLMQPYPGGLYDDPTLWLPDQVPAQKASRSRVMPEIKVWRDEGAIVHGVQFARVRDRFDVFEQRARKYAEARA